jgi:hypothetical protein
MADISQEQLQELLEQNRSLIERNKQLAEALGNEEKGSYAGLKPNEIKDRTVRITFVDGKAIKGFVNRGTDTRPSYVYEKPDPENPKERILYVDVALNGVKEALSVPYNQLLREGLREECRVVKVKEEEWREVQGQTVQKVVNNYSTEETGVIVPIEVLGKTRIFTVELPDGGEMDIHENYVNI